MRGDADAMNAGAAGDDIFEFLDRIEIQPNRNAEPIAQRRGQQSQPGGRRHQREFGQIDLDRPRRRPFADDEVQLIILHGRIEDFLDRRIEPMDLVDEEDVAFFQIGQKGGEITGLGDHRTGGGAEIDTQLAADDLRQRRLAKPRRPDEQHMIERLAPGPRRLDENLQVFARRRLADEIVERLRTQAGVDIILALFRRQQALRGGHRISSDHPRKVSRQRRRKPPILASR